MHPQSFDHELHRHDQGQELPYTIQPTLLRDQTPFQSLTSALQAWSTSPAGFSIPSSLPSLPLPLKRASQDFPDRQGERDGRSRRYRNSTGKMTKAEESKSTGGEEDEDDELPLGVGMGVSAFGERRRNGKGRDPLDASNVEDDLPIGDDVEVASWASWDEIRWGTDESFGRETTSRLLLLGFSSTSFHGSGLVIYDLTNLDEVSLLLNLPLSQLSSIVSKFEFQKGDRGKQKQSRNSRRESGGGRTLNQNEIVAANVVPPLRHRLPEVGDWRIESPMLAILLAGDGVSQHEHTSSSSLVESLLVFYSLASKKVVHQVRFPGQATSLKMNDRFVVVATKSPLALHTLSLSTPFLHPTPFSPLHDIAPDPLTGNPVFDLGSGGRLLAYATTRPLASYSHSSPSVRQKNRTGIVASPRVGFDGPEHQATGSGADRNNGGSLGTATSTGKASAEVVGDATRRAAETVAGGITGGIKHIKGYWQSMSMATPATNPATATGTSTMPGGEHGEDRVGFSKSAPQGDSSNFYGLSLPNRRLSWNRGHAATREAGGNERVPQSGGSRIPPELSDIAFGYVAVVDLLAPPAPPPRGSRRQGAQLLPRSMAHFRATTSPVVLLSLSPSSNYVLVSSSKAHHFDIFELRPPVVAGQSSFRSVSSPSAVDLSGSKVWHRYRLDRGVTPAVASYANWSPDGKLVGVGTSRGTIHVYAIQPFGGLPSLQSAFAPQVYNSQELQPLSTRLRSIARLRQPRTGSVFAAAPVMRFLSKTETISTSFWPDENASSSSLAQWVAASFQDALVFRPKTGQVYLQRLSLVVTPKQTSSSPSPAAERLKSTVSTTVSALTQLLNSEGSMAYDSVVEMAISASAKAVWALSAREKLPDTTTALPTTGSQQHLVWRRRRARWVSGVELDTFSRSMRVLPRTVYLSFQLEFFRLMKGFNHQAPISPRDLCNPALRLQVRDEVVIRRGRQRKGSSGIPNEGDDDNFGEPIRSAMHTILDADPSFANSSPSALTPTFPNGLPAKYGGSSWGLSYPSNLPKVEDGLRWGQKRYEELKASRRRRKSQACSSSVSFEDDAVLADSADADSVLGSPQTPLTNPLDHEDTLIEEVEPWVEDEGQFHMELPEATGDLDQDDYDDLSLIPPPPPVSAPAPAPTPDSELTTATKKPKFGGRKKNKKNKAAEVLPPPPEVEEYQVTSSDTLDQDFFTPSSQALFNRNHQPLTPTPVSPPPSNAMTMALKAVKSPPSSLTSSQAEISTSPPTGTVTPPPRSQTQTPRARRKGGKANREQSQES